MRSPGFFLLPAGLLLLCGEAPEWDAKGHRVVAAIAWAHIDAGTRMTAVELLRAAAADSDLLLENAASTMLGAERDRAPFLRAATDRSGTTARNAGWQVNRKAG